jgi:hypothetical protein
LRKTFPVFVVLAVVAQLGPWRAAEAGLPGSSRRRGPSPPGSGRRDRGELGGAWKRPACRPHWGHAGEAGLRLRRCRSRRLGGEGGSSLPAFACSHRGDGGAGLRDILLNCQRKAGSRRRGPTTELRRRRRAPRGRRADVDLRLSHRARGELAARRSATAAPQLRRAKAWGRRRGVGGAAGAACAHELRVGPPMAPGSRGRAPGRRRGPPALGVRLARSRLRWRSGSCTRHASRPRRRPRAFAGLPEATRKEARTRIRARRGFMIGLRSVSEKGIMCGYYTRN